MDRILEIQALRAGLVADMEALLAACGEDGLSAEAQASYDKLTAKDDKLAAELSKLRDIEARKAALATQVPLPGNPAAPAATVPAAPAEKGLRAGAALRILAAAQGNFHIAAQIAEQRGASGLFANQSVGSGPQGGFLVAEDIAEEVIELTRPASVVLASQPIIMPMPNGNMTINRGATGANASYVGEQEDANATGMTFGQIVLRSKKLRALVPISNDLIRATGAAADRYVRDELVQSLATEGDLGLLRGAGTEFTPLGLRNQLVGKPEASTNILAMTATPDLAKVTTDLGKLELAIENGNVPMIRPTWFMAPRVRTFLQNLRDGNGNYAFPEVASGQLRGKPIRVTTHIPTNLGGGTESEIILADMAHVVVGEFMGIQIAMSTEASYKDAAGNQRNAFGEDTTLMRAIAQHDIGLRHLRAVSVLTGVTWGA